MTDADLLALCVLEEAGGEPDDGKAAVARVIFNRIHARFRSDGTMIGTVLARDQFSWAYFEMRNRVYTRIAHTTQEAQAVADRLLIVAKTAQPKTFARCAAIAEQVRAGTYAGDAYAYMTDDAVNYLNPAIIARLPAWATPDKQVCVIGHHHFYRS